MSINKPGTTHAFNAEAAVEQYRIVKHGTNDGDVEHAAAATDAMFGVVGFLGQDTAGNRVDIILDGPVEVEYGGTVALGDPLTSDATGRAIKSAPAAGATHRSIGFATVGGVVGDVGSMQIELGHVQTANQAAFQADSSAADTAAMIVDFNALLAKLVAAGVMAAS